MPFYCRLFLASLALLWSHSSVAYERVISLAPHITELIYAIGAEDRLIATVKSSNHPTAAQHLPRIGDGVSVSAEQLLALKPDAVFAWQATRALVALEPTLKQSGIALHYIHPQSLSDIAASALQLGLWLNRAEPAQTLSQQWLDQIAHWQQQSLSIEPQTVFIALSSQPLHSLNDPVINDVLRLCGAKNWAVDNINVAPAINVEQLLARPADALIYSKDDTHFSSLQQWLARIYTTAPSAYEVDPDQFYRASPRLFTATEQLCLAITQSKKPISQTKKH